MDIRTLYTLIAIADHGSFAEAGNTIGLSLSAVSMQVRALEDELGITIFDRSRRPPILTDTGLALVHRARDLIAHWESMSAALKKGTSSGLLRLGSVHTCVSGVLPLALRHLQKQGHGLEVHVTTGLTHDLERAIYHRQLDVAIVTEPDAPRSGLDFLPFVEEQLVVIAHRSVKGASDQEILEQNPYVRFNRSARVGHLVQEEMVRRRITVRSTMEIDNLEGVIAMVANGLGASVVPACRGRNEFPPGIRVIPFGSPTVTRRLGILAPKENPRAHLTQLLLDALKSVCAGQRDGAEQAGSHL
ncbi:LysR substrate-binding domain-containing protein [Achromobacter xylosoxidans]|uniref:LysR substrate-binding domain-containing protein n=1 Tax=Alcaligenes xylosoxydans xylosoxydans TaxID=85698 RepID=UPI000B4938D4|nr:LysR substrate-binding domain-containing protein [Achromobacter xylosoxidans]